MEATIDPIAVTIEETDETTTPQSEKNLTRTSFIPQVYHITMRITYNPLAKPLASPCKTRRAKKSPH